MRKVIISERQLNNFLGEDYGTYLGDVKDSNGIPDNAYGTQVFTDNTDDDAVPNVTTGDNISQKRANSNFLFHRGHHGTVCEELDDEKSYLGKKSKAYIQQVAQNGGGKMSKNIANKMENGGQRLNTTEVQKSRLKKEKKENPVLFAANGGNNTVKALDSMAKKQRNFGRALSDTEKTTNVSNNPNIIIPDANKGTGKGHHSNNNVYYY